jgi:hypothetical protein
MVRSHSHDGGFNCRRQVSSEPPRASPCFERARICGGQQGPSHRSHGPELSAHALRQDACALPRQTVPRGAEGLGRATQSGHAEFPASGWYLKRPLLRVFGIPQNCVRRPVYPLSLGLGLARRHWIICAVWPFGLQALREGEPNDGLLSADGSCSAQARQ